jgi:Flp pilus assembly pilin Flp
MCRHRNLGSLRARRGRGTTTTTVTRPSLAPAASSDNRPPAPTGRRVRGILRRSREACVRPGANDDGVSSVEYVLIAAFIALVAAVAIISLGGNVLGLYQKGVEIPWDGQP